MAVPLWGKFALAGSWVVAVAADLAEGIGLLESAAKQAPALVVLGVVVYIFVKASQAKDKLFADAMAKGAERDGEVANALGQLRGVLETLDLRKKRE